MPEYDRYDLYEMAHALSSIRNAIHASRDASTGYVARKAYAGDEDGPTKAIFYLLDESTTALLEAEKLLSEMSMDAMSGR